MVTRVSLRQNISEDVWADIFDGSAPRAYLLWAAAMTQRAGGLLLAGEGEGDDNAVPVVQVLGHGVTVNCLGEAAGVTPHAVPVGEG